jgi:hypothetical protein
VARKPPYNNTFAAVNDASDEEFSIIFEFTMETKGPTPPVLRANPNNPTLYEAFVHCVVPQFSAVDGGAMVLLSPPKEEEFAAGAP